MIDLELVDTGALIHELMKRYDTGLIMLSSNQTESADRWRSARRGDRMQLVGMMEWQKKSIIDEIEERVTLQEQRFIPAGCGDPNCLDCNSVPEDFDLEEHIEDDEDEDDEDYDPIEGYDHP